jgi:hypothetical protein
MLDLLLLGVPFIAPRQLGAVGTPFGRQFLPSVRRCTGLSGGAPESEQYTTHNPMIRCFPFCGAPDRPVCHVTVGACRRGR